MQIKSTTNFIIIFTFVSTAIVLLLSLFIEVKLVDPVITGFWGTLIGFIVGAKATKMKAEKTEVQDDIDKSLKDLID